MPRIAKTIYKKVKKIEGLTLATSRITVQLKLQQSRQCCVGNDTQIYQWKTRESRYKLFLAQLIDFCTRVNEWRMGSLSKKWCLHY